MPHEMRQSLQHSRRGLGVAAAQHRAPCFSMALGVISIRISAGTATSNAEKRMNVLDFFSTGACKQILPGVGFKNKKRQGRLTTCPECPGIIIVGQCLRDQTREKIAGAAPPKGTPVLKK